MTSGIDKSTHGAQYVSKLYSLYFMPGVLNKKHPALMLPYECSGFQMDIMLSGSPFRIPNVTRSSTSLCIQVIKW